MKIWIVGVPGAGKSTLAKDLSFELKFVQFQLDELRWDRNWNMIASQMFIDRVNGMLAYDSLIVEGSYNESDPILFAAVDVLVWIDVSRFCSVKRVLVRTIRNILKREKLFNDCRESISRCFSRDSIVLYSYREFAPLRIKYRRILKVFEGKSFHVEGTNNDVVNDVLKYVNAIDGCGGRSKNCIR